MTRGTTPTLTFSVPYTRQEMEEVYVTMVQFGRTVLELTGQDLELADNQIAVQLSQEQTLQLRPDRCSIQIRLRLSGGRAAASQIISVPVGDILKEGVI